MDFEGNFYIASSHVNERMTHLNAKRLGAKRGCTIYQYWGFVDEFRIIA